MIKLVLILAFCFSVTASYRIDGNVRPINYNLVLTLADDFVETKTFKGTVKITLTKTRRLGDVSHIQLHKAKDLLIDEGKVFVRNEGNTALPMVGITYNETSEIYDIELRTYLSYQTQYTLEIIDFTGKLYDDNYGFYLSSYTDEQGEKQYIATTQFQATYARRAFPCFDEPEYKSTFNIEINHPLDYATVLSNQELEETLPEKSVFKATPVMSTYLVAFIVSKFDYVDAPSSTKIQIYSRTGTQDIASYAAEVSGPILTKLNGFVNTAYSTLGIRKIDQVALSDFAAGAMENWGLVTYRESNLLWDPQHSTTMNKQRIAAVIAHEFAHKWFGNWVTLKWWKDTWLNEGFARYFQYHITQEAVSTPEDDWELQNQFVTAELQTIFASDSVVASMALSSDATTQSEISAKFDTISYAKGGAIVRMIEHMVGYTAFRNSLRNYLNNFKYGNTEPSDLLSYFTHPNIENFAEFMRNWIYESGFPIVTASVSANTVHLSQERFVYEGFASTKWNVPISYSLSNAHDFEDTTPKLFISATSGQQETFDLGNADYPILNVRQSGYYRVNYDTVTWGKIADALKSDNFDNIVDINRAQIVDDVMNLARIGKVEYTLALNVIQFLENEVSYYPWYAAFNAYSFLLKRLSEDNLKSSIQSNVLSSMNTLYKLTTFTPADDMKHLEKLRNSLVLEWACKLGDGYCLGNSTKLFNEYKANTNQLVNPDLRNVVYCAGVDQSKDDWSFLWNVFRTNTVATETAIILTALGCTHDTDILQQYLQYSLDNTIIRAQDAYSVYTSVLSGTPEGVDVAFEFLKNHYEDIRVSYGSMNALLRVINSLADRLTTQEQVNEFEQFVNDNRENLEDAAVVADSAIATAKSNIAWTNKYISHLNCYYLNVCPTDGDDGANTINLSWVIILITTMYYILK